MGHKYLDSFLNFKKISDGNKNQIDFSKLTENKIQEKKTKSDSNYYPPEFYAKKLEVEERFFGKCFLCEEEGSDIHHIDYNTMNNDDSNLMYLCKSCHSKTNFGRSSWEKNLKKRMAEKFKFFYYGGE